MDVTLMALTDKSSKENKEYSVTYCNLYVLNIQITALEKLAGGQYQQFLANHFQQFLITCPPGVKHV
jgi:hypothetical protein